MDGAQGAVGIIKESKVCCGGFRKRQREQGEFWGKKKKSNQNFLKLIEAVNVFPRTTQQISSKINSYLHQDTG